MLPKLFRAHPKKLVAAGVLVGLPLLAHLGVAFGTGIDAPPITVPTGEPHVSATDADLARLGPAWARHKGKILEVSLEGTPEEIGYRHARLLRRPMVENEGALLGDFEKYVPVAPLRWLIMDVSRVEFRHVDRGMPPERRREIAAQAAGFSPDPYASLLPTYHRFVFLQSLYDIALSFEHSPLLGCTSFALTDEAFEGGHVVLARNFDFEAGPIFDEGKAVFVVREKDRIPYASVAWPGFIGAVTGMNAEGVALVVHGARARSARNEGEPVVHTMREILGRAHTTEEAVKLLEKANPMVSHMVMLADPKGDIAIVERVPGEAPFIRRARGKVGLTNHLEGPLQNDPANRRVEAVTSTLPRRRRLDELLEALPKGAPVEKAVALLRDRKGLTDSELPLGSRKAIDALIATHGVLMDTTARVLWVSESPHLLGRFVRFDLAAAFATSEPPARGTVEAVPADPILENGAYAAWLKQGSPHVGEP